MAGFRIPGLHIYNRDHPNNHAKLPAGAGRPTFTIGDTDVYLGRRPPPAQPAPLPVRVSPPQLPSEALHQIVQGLDGQGAHRTLLDMESSGTDNRTSGPVVNSVVLEPQIDTDWLIQSPLRQQSDRAHGSSGRTQSPLRLRPDRARGPSGPIRVVNSAGLLRVNDQFKKSLAELTPSNDQEPTWHRRLVNTQGHGGPGAREEQGFVPHRVIGR